jgi:hypothetical protein
VLDVEGARIERLEVEFRAPPQDEVDAAAPAVS